MCSQARGQTNGPRALFTARSVRFGKRSVRLNTSSADKCPRCRMHHMRRAFVIARHRPSCERCLPFAPLAPRCPALLVSSRSCSPLGSLAPLCSAPPVSPRLSRSAWVRHQKITKWVFVHAGATACALYQVAVSLCPVVPRT